MPLCMLGITIPALPASLGFYREQERWKCRENCGLPNLGAGAHRALQFTEDTVEEARASGPSGHRFRSAATLSCTRANKWRNQRPLPTSGKKDAGGPARPGTGCASRHERKEAPWAHREPGPRDPQTATAVEDLHTSSQLPGSAERRSCLGSRGVRERCARMRRG